MAGLHSPRAIDSRAQNRNRISGPEKRSSEPRTKLREHKSARRKLFPFEFENSETGFGRMKISYARIRSQNFRTRPGTIFAPHFCVSVLKIDPLLCVFPTLCTGSLVHLEVTLCVVPLPIGKLRWPTYDWHNKWLYRPLFSCIG